MTKHRKHIIPDLEDWPITKFSKDKEAFIERLGEYTFNRIKRQQQLDVNEVLDATVFLENKRTSKNRWKVDPADEKVYWNKIRDVIRKASQAENKEEELDRVLKKIIHRYAVELVGSFNPRTFKFARKFLKAFFSRLYNPRRFFKIINRYGTYEELLSKIKVYGHVDELRNLFSKGTVVVVPTHFSNLDSILIGYAIDSVVGTPAFIYGAGLNLYNTEIIAFYMNRLGTYRVDRRKKNRVYIETLKSMNTLSLIEGVNNLFFPGGTRSRSGATEDQLKLGLLNSVVESQRHCIQQGIDQKIYIVPLITSYPTVLDAGSLIHDYLRGFGKEKYNSPRRKQSLRKIFFNYLKKTRKTDTYMAMNFGKPMDVFGNALNDQGESLDAHGNIVDLSHYFEGLDGTETKVQREYIYTKKLAQNLVRSFKTEKIVLPSNLVAFAALRLIMKQNQETDIFSLLRYSLDQIALEKTTLIMAVEMLMKKLVTMQNAGEIVLFEEMPSSTEVIVEEGIRHLGVYHIHAPLKRISDHILGTDSLDLLYFYHNQMKGYGLEEWFDVEYDQLN